MDPITLILIGVVALYVLGSRSSTPPAAGQSASTVTSTASTNALGAALQQAIKQLSAPASSSGGSSKGGGSGGGLGGGSASNGTGAAGKSSGGQSLGLGNSSVDPTTGYNAASDAFNANLQTMGDDDHMVDGGSVNDNSLLTPDESTQPTDIYASTDSIEQGIADSGWYNSSGGGTWDDGGNESYQDQGDWEL